MNALAFIQRQGNLLLRWRAGRFIEAALSLGFDCEYCRSEDGFDFMAWNPKDEEQVAKIKL